jgi:hypothetical protein
MAGRLFIASPAYSATYCAEYVESLVNTIKDCSNYDIPTLYKQVNGVHWIDIARDILAHIFLHTDCTHMLQIDADLGWSPDAPRRMMATDKSIIGGAYPYKSDDITSYPVKPESLPGGFLMVKREVIEKMEQGLPKYKCASLPYGELSVAPLFTREMRADGYTGEDFMFCKRAKAAGFDLAIEPDIDFAHVGLKAWRGNYGKTQCLATY